MNHRHSIQSVLFLVPVVALIALSASTTTIHMVAATTTTPMETTSGVSPATTSSFQPASTSTQPAPISVLCNGNSPYIQSNMQGQKLTQSCFPGTYWAPSELRLITPPDVPSMYKGTVSNWAPALLWPTAPLDVVWDNVNFDNSGSGGPFRCGGIHIDVNSTTVQNVNVIFKNFQANINYAFPTSSNCDNFNIVVHSRVPIRLHLEITDSNFPGSVEVRAPLAPGSNITITRSTIQRELFIESKYVPLRMEDSSVNIKFVIASRQPVVPANDLVWQQTAVGLPPVSALFPPRFPDVPWDEATMLPAADSKLAFWCRNSVLKAGVNTTFAGIIEGNETSVLLDKCDFSSSYEGAAMVLFFARRRVVRKFVPPFFQDAGVVGVQPEPWETASGGFNVRVTRGSQFTGARVLIGAEMDNVDKLLPSEQTPERYWSNFYFEDATFTQFATYTSSLEVVALTSAGDAVTMHRSSFLNVTLLRCNLASSSEIQIAQWSESVKSAADPRVSRLTFTVIDSSVNGKFAYAQCIAGPAPCAMRMYHNLNFRTSNIATLDAAVISSSELDVDFLITGATGFGPINVHFANAARAMQAYRLNFTALQSVSRTFALNCLATKCDAVKLNTAHFYFEEASWQYDQALHYWPLPVQNRYDFFGVGFAARILAPFTSTAGPAAPLNLRLPANGFPSAVYQITFRDGANPERGIAIQSAPTTHTLTLLLNLQNLSMSQTVFLVNPVKALSQISIKDTIFTGEACLVLNDTSALTATLPAETIKPAPTIVMENVNIQQSGFAAACVAPIVDRRIGHYDYILVNASRISVSTAVASARTFAGFYYQENPDAGGTGAGVPYSAVAISIDDGTFTGPNPGTFVYAATNAAIQIKPFINIVNSNFTFDDQSADGFIRGSGVFVNVPPADATISVSQTTIAWRNVFAYESNIHLIFGGYPRSVTLTDVDIRLDNPNAPVLIMGHNADSSTAVYANKAELTIQGDNTNIQLTSGMYAGLLLSVQTARTVNLRGGVINISAGKTAFVAWTATSSSTLSTALALSTEVAVGGGCNLRLQSYACADRLDSTCQGAGIVHTNPRTTPFVRVVFNSSARVYATALNSVNLLAHSMDFSMASHGSKVELEINEAQVTVVARAPILFVATGLGVEEFNNNHSLIITGSTTLVTITSTGPVLSTSSGGSDGELWGSRGFGTAFMSLNGDFDVTIGNGATITLVVSGYWDMPKSVAVISSTAHFITATTSTASSSVNANGATIVIQDQRTFNNSNFQQGSLVVLAGGGSNGARNTGLVWSLSNLGVTITSDASNSMVASAGSAERLTLWVSGGTYNVTANSHRVHWLFSSAVPYMDVFYSGVKTYLRSTAQHWQAYVPVAAISGLPNMVSGLHIDRPGSSADATNESAVPYRFYIAFKDGSLLDIHTVMRSVAGALLTGNNKGCIMGSDSKTVFNWKSSQFRLTDLGAAGSSFAVNGLGLFYDQRTSPDTGMWDCPAFLDTDGGDLYFDVPPDTVSSIYVNINSTFAGNATIRNSMVVSARQLTRALAVTLDGRVGSLKLTFTVFNYSDLGVDNSSVVTVGGDSSNSMLLQAYIWDTHYFEHGGDASNWTQPRLLPSGYVSPSNFNPYISCNTFNGVPMVLNESAFTAPFTNIYYQPCEQTTSSTTSTTTSSTTTTTETTTTTSTETSTTSTTTTSEQPSTTTTAESTVPAPDSSTVAPAGDVPTSELPETAIATTSEVATHAATQAANSTTTTSTTTTSSTTTTTDTSTTTSTTTTTPEPTRIEAQKVAQAAAVAATAAGASTALLMPSPATAVLAGRLGMIGKVSDCQPRLNQSLEFYESPAQIAIKMRDGEAASDDVQYHLGGIVVNFAIVLGVIALSLGVGAIHYFAMKGRRPHLTWAESRAFARFPSVLVFPCLFFSQPFVGSSIAVVLHGDTASTIIAAIILLTMLGMIGGLVMCVTTTARFMATFRTKKELDDADAARGDPELQDDCLDKFGDGFDRYVLGNTGEWFDIPQKYVSAGDPAAEATKVPVDELKAAAPTHFTVAYGGLFDAYRGGRQGWLAVDFGAALVLGLADGLLASFGCSAAGWILVAIFGLYTMSLLFLRPMTTRFETIVGFLVACLQLVAATIAVLTAGADPTSDGPQAVATVSTCALMLGTFQALFICFCDAVKWMAMYGKGCFARRAARKQEERQVILHKREEERAEMDEMHDSGTLRDAAAVQFRTRVDNVEEMIQIANDREGTLADRLISDLMEGRVDLPDNAPAAAATMHLKKMPSSSSFRIEIPPSAATAAPAFPDAVVLSPSWAHNDDDDISDNNNNGEDALGHSINPVEMEGFAYQGTLQDRTSRLLRSIEAEDAYGLKKNADVRLRPQDTVGLDTLRTMGRATAARGGEAAGAGQHVNLGGGSLEVVGGGGGGGQRAGGKRGQASSSNNNKAAADDPDLAYL